MADLGAKINDIKKNFLENPALQQLDKKKVIGILFVAVVLIYLDLSLLMSLQLNAIKRTDADFKKLSTEMAHFNKEYAQSQRTQGGTTLTKEIISEAEIPLLLQDIQAIANKNNVKILQLNPAKEAKAKKAAATDLNSHLISMDLICDYQSLGAFIGELENTAKFMTAEELKIKPDANSIFQQSANLVIKTYLRK